MSSIVLLVGVQGTYSIKINEDRKYKDIQISEISNELKESSESVNRLQKLLKETKTSFDNKSKEAKEVENKLKQEQENVKELKKSLKEAVAKKQEREKQLYANNDAQEVVQSNEIYNEPVEQTQTQTESVVNGSGSGMVFESTAYDGYAMGGMTASGVRINSQGDRIIAVDPSVIPLGSRVYVEGYGEAIAADTGGAIKGNIIDLNMSEAEAVQWGRRPVNITILD